MISTSLGLLYVHLPKTAGNALQAALRPYADDTFYANPRQDGIQRFGLRSPFGTGKHATLAEYHDALGAERFWSLLRCTTVRNPWERAISFYFSPHRGPTAWNRDAFIRSLDGLASMCSALHLPPAAVPDGRRPIEVVLRHERLADDIAALAHRLGIAAPALARLNAGSHRDHRSYYDDGLAALVGSRYADDIAAFGYGF